MRNAKHGDAPTKNVREEDFTTEDTESTEEDG